MLPHYHADIINNAKATKKLQLCNEKRETKQWKRQFCPKGAKRGWEGGGRRRDDEVMKKDARRYSQTGIALHCCCCFMFYLISRKLYYNDKCKASYVHRGSRWHFHLHDGRERVFKFERTILEYGVQSVRSSMCWFNLGSKQLPRHSFPLHEAWTQLVSINIRTPYTAARTCLLSLALYLSFPRWQRLLTCTACNLHVHKDLPKLSFSFTLQGTRRGRHHRIVPERVLCGHMLCHCAKLELKILFVLKLA